MATRWSCNPRKAGGEARIKSAGYKNPGRMSYGWLKSESGVHRLVRIRPLGKGNSGRPPWPAVWVYPVVDDKYARCVCETLPTSAITIPTNATSRAGGPAREHPRFGGRDQQCAHGDRRDEFREIAAPRTATKSSMKALKSRLYQMELERRTALRSRRPMTRKAARAGATRSGPTCAALQNGEGPAHPGVETSDTSGVLDGDLGPVHGVVDAGAGGSGKSPGRRPGAGSRLSPNVSTSTGGAGTGTTNPGDGRFPPRPRSNASRYRRFPNWGSRGPAYKRSGVWRNAWRSLARSRGRGAGCSRARRMAGASGADGG